MHAKYSKPDIHYGLPNWNEKNHELVWEHRKSDYIIPCGIFRPREYYYECDIWQIGNKRIEVRLYFIGESERYSGSMDIIPNSYYYYWKKLALVIYQVDTLERLENEKMAIQNNEINERERKEKEDIEKAIKAL